MPCYAAFHLGLHSLPKYPFKGFQYTIGKLFILMDYPIHIDTISMELPILCFKGSQVKIMKNLRPLRLFLS